MTESKGLSAISPIVDSVEPLDPRVAAVFDDIRKTRNTDFINNFWRVAANYPDLLEATWNEMKKVMRPGALDPVTKELIYVAVSITNGCQYCIRSHTTAARAKGATEEMIGELIEVAGAANKLNRLANGLQVPVDDAFADMTDR